VDQVEVEAAAHAQVLHQVEAQVQQVEVVQEVVQVVDQVAVQVKVQDQVQEVVLQANANASHQVEKERNSIYGVMKSKMMMIQFQQELLN